MTEHARATHPYRGRAAGFNPENRFEKLHLQPDPESIALAGPELPTQFFVDGSRRILAKNDSPDVSFDFSLNPYRGCEHGCIYCYARPTHEYLGFSAGLDFESRVLVKMAAPELLAQALSADSWQPQLVALSGNTDCYQPVEKQLRLTRKCLKVFLQHRNPVGIITKNALVLRDLDILGAMVSFNIIRVVVSITTLDGRLASRMEPRASTPQKRLEALAKLVEAGIPAGVNVAPLIPGLTEHEVPAILQAAADCGVKQAGYILLRLPHAVKDLFVDWLRSVCPERRNKVMNAVKETRAGRLNDPCFTTRLQGEGIRAETIARMFQLNCRRYGLNPAQSPTTTKHFRRQANGQGELF
jgi:DNA repair photolyase